MGKCGGEGKGKAGKAGKQGQGGALGNVAGVKAALPLGVGKAGEGRGGAATRLLGITAGVEVLGARRQRNAATRTVRNATNVTNDRNVRTQRPGRWRGKVSTSKQRQAGEGWVQPRAQRTVTEQRITVTVNQINALGTRSTINTARRCHGKGWAR